MQAPDPSPFDPPLPVEESAQEQADAEVSLPPLASLTQRALGAAVDGALLAIPVLLSQLRLRPAELGTASDSLLLTVLFLLSLLGAVNVHLLLDRGQTLGKMAVQSRIVQVDGSRAGFGHLIWRRVLINGFLGALLPVYLFIDPMFILRLERRCVHDYLAGTIVVKA